MHEICIMEETLNLAMESAMAQKAEEILEITMTIGKMSGVVPSALEFAFDVIKESSIKRYPFIMMKNMILTIELLPIICYCDSCGVNFQPDEWIFQCPQCHQFSNKIIQGKEIKLTSLKIS